MVSPELEKAGLGAGIKQAEEKSSEKITNRLAREVRQERAKSGELIIGKYPDYVNKGDEIGAKTFEIPYEVWKKMTPEEQWAANQKALDRAISNGNKIKLSNPINEKTYKDNFKKEIDYLRSKGYDVSPDGKEMIKQK